jgi:hypothetical protein
MYMMKHNWSQHKMIIGIKAPDIEADSTMTILIHTTHTQKTIDKRSQR